MRQAAISNLSQIICVDDNKKALPFEESPVL
jgi:hypothetical protein